MNAIAISHHPMRYKTDGGMEDNVGVDELLANAGYRVRASELAHVAERLEQLETMLGAVQDAGVSHLSMEAVHYNPSDLAGWIESMLEELAAPTVIAGNTPTQKMPQITTDHSALPAVRDIFPLEHAMSQESATENKHLQQDVFMDGFLQQYGGVEQACGPNDDPLSDIFANMYPDDQPQIKQGVIPIEEIQIQPILKDRKQPEHHLLHQRNADSASNSEINPFQRHGQPVLRLSEKNGLTGSSRSSVQMGRYNQNAAGCMDGSASASGADYEQDSGVTLVHLLVACAQAVQRNEFVAADNMVRQIRALASSHTGPFKRVATQFVEALARRIYGFSAQDNISNQSDSLSELLHLHFYESCPYLKFGHFTANQAILEAFQPHKQVHVIDLNPMHGLQWPALIQALALRPGGPPFLRITTVSPPGGDLLQQIGMKLLQLAKSVNVRFDYRVVVAAKLQDVQPWMLRVSEGEAVAVNAVQQLHRLLYSDTSSSPPAIMEVLRWARSVSPRIFTLVEYEANHNSPIFLERFMEALHHYSAMFDSMEGCNLAPHSLEHMLSETYLAREIFNIVACEGEERVERHEPLSQWRWRMCNAGFQPLHLGSHAFRQARMLLTLFPGEGYVVEENGGCLTLGWHSRPLLAASAWQC